MGETKKTKTRPDHMCILPPWEASNVYESLFVPLQGFTSPDMCFVGATNFSYPCELQMRLRSLDNTLEGCFRNSQPDLLPKFCRLWAENDNRMKPDILGILGQSKMVFCPIIPSVAFNVVFHYILPRIETLYFLVTPCASAVRAHHHDWFLLVVTARQGVCPT